MPEEHYLVIGNGPAGNQAALTIKEQAPDVRVTLVSKESGGCYRPDLLPDFISGKITEEGLFPSGFAQYREKGIKLRSRQRVTAVDPVERKVFLDHRETLSFDGLIIAVGGRPRIPEPFLHFRELMLTLKTLGDAKIWIETLSRADRILIIGGDLTSLALTKSLLGMKKEVLFVINEEAFWPLKFNERLFEEVAHALSSKGVRPLRYRRFKGMTRITERTIQVRLDNEDIETEVVGAFFGLVPDVGFLARSGFVLDRGLLVDETLNTGYEGIYAAGDCAQVYHPDICDYWVSIGFHNAVTLGRIAALNVLGEGLEIKTPGKSIFDLHGVKTNTSWWLEF